MKRYMVIVSLVLVAGILTLSAKLPPGTYKANCKECSFKNEILTCSCQAGENTFKSTSLRGISDSTYVKNKNGVLVQMSREEVCSYRKEGGYNHDNGRCCPKGQQYSNEHNQLGRGGCCKPGLVFSNTGKPGKGICCLPGAYNPTSKRCCTSGKAFSNPTGKTGQGNCCPLGSGYNPETRQCCPAGKVYSNSTGKAGEGGCCPPGGGYNPETQQCCPVGQGYSNPTGQPGQGRCCPLGSGYNPLDGECCPEGQTFINSSGKASGGGCCPPESQYDDATRTCEQCLPGSYNPHTGTCCSQEKGYNPVTGTCCPSGKSYIVYTIPAPGGKEALLQICA